MASWSDAKKKEEENKVAENEWHCDHCGTKNFWNEKEIKTSYCSKCVKKNDMIYQMILLSNDKNYLNGEDQANEYYKNEMSRSMNNSSGARSNQPK